MRCVPAAFLPLSVPFRSHCSLLDSCTTACAPEAVRNGFPWRDWIFDPARKTGFLEKPTHRFRFANSIIKLKLPFLGPLLFILVRHYKKGCGRSWARSRTASRKMCGQLILLQIRNLGLWMKVPANMHKLVRTASAAILHLHNSTWTCLLCPTAPAISVLATLHRWRRANIHWGPG